MAPLGPSIHWVGNVIVFVFVFVCDGNNSAHIIKCSLVWTKGISEWAKWSFLVTAINPLTAWLLSLLMVCLFVNENSFSATQRWTTTAALSATPAIRATAAERPWSHINSFLIINRWENTVIHRFVISTEYFVGWRKFDKYFDAKSNKRMIIFLTSEIALFSMECISNAKRTCSSLHFRIRKDNMVAHATAEQRIRNRLAHYVCMCVCCTRIRFAIRIRILDSA